MNIILTTLMAVVPFASSIESAVADPANLNTLFKALRQAETGGMPNEGLGAIGDDGRSIGPYQISQAYWQDARMPYGTWMDCLYNKEYSEQVMRRYWLRYCSSAFNDGNWEVLSRIHNGGPKGHKKKATLSYWKKVKAYMGL